MKRKEPKPLIRKIKYYRLLNDGEIMRHGDEHFIDGNWFPIVLVGDKFDSKLHAPVRCPVYERDFA